MPSAFLSSMQMAASQMAASQMAASQMAASSTVAIGTSYTPASGASAIENSVAAGTQGSSQFADGLQALLSADGPDSGTSGGEIPNEDAPSAGSDANQQLGGNLIAPSARTAPAMFPLDRSGTSLRPKPAALVQSRLTSPTPPLEAVASSSPARGSSVAGREKCARPAHAGTSSEAATAAGSHAHSEPPVATPIEVPSFDNLSSAARAASGQIATASQSSTDSAAHLQGSKKIHAWSDAAESQPESTQPGSAPPASSASANALQPALHASLHSHPAAASLEPAPQPLASAANRSASEPPSMHAADASSAHVQAAESNATPARNMESTPPAGRSFKSASRSLALPTSNDFASTHTPAQSGAVAIPLHGAAGQSSISSNPSSSASAQSAAPRDAFSSIDAATPGPETTWIRAGAHHAEAGYLDPSLGWVSVRAEATTSGVHAAVVPGSPEAASALSNHLAGLNAFLADHHGHASNVTLASPESSDSFSANSQRDNSGNGPEGQRQQQQPDSNAPSSLREPGISASSLAAPPSPGIIPAANRSGVHLSVMA